MLDSLSDTITEYRLIEAGRSIQQKESNSAAILPRSDTDDSLESMIESLEMKDSGMGDPEEPVSLDNNPINPPGLFYYCELD